MVFRDEWMYQLSGGVTATMNARMKQDSGCYRMKVLTVLTYCGICLHSEFVAAIITAVVTGLVFGSVISGCQHSRSQDCSSNYSLL